MSPPMSHCASLIREHDHDRYLCALFAPAEAREAWFALFAFNHELAIIAESVSEEMIGFVRFAWWREALGEIYAGGQVRKHPVVEALAKAVAAHRLPRAPLDAMLDARQERLGGEPFATPEQWENYFRATSSGLLALCALAAGEQASPALEKLGILWAATGTARVMDEEQLFQMARQALSDLPPQIETFVPFCDAAEFYLKRHGKGQSGAVGLLLTLLWKRTLRRIRRV